jgi:hypothetical protein
MKVYKTKTEEEKTIGLRNRIGEWRMVRNNEPVHCPIESQLHWKLDGCQSCCRRKHRPFWSWFWGSLVPPLKIDAFFCGFK